MKIGFAQINTTVGDFPGNCARIIAAYDELSAAGADVVITPELSITGYPPQDLLFKSRFVPDNLAALEKLHQHVRRAALVVGFVDMNLAAHGRPFHNAAAVLQHSQKPQVIHKSLLPTYDVFDEARYFEPAKNHPVVFIGEHKVGITICEDIWTHEYLSRPLYMADPVAELVNSGVSCILNLSASPFQTGKPALRLAMIRGLATKYGVPFYYCNAVGGNDQLVFDGHSLAVNSQGALIWQGVSFGEDSTVVDDATPPPALLEPREDIADLYDALVLGLRDYMAKCGFTKCVLGLSGGIDSAITAAIAAAAVGPENVMGVAMPTKYSSDHSVGDADLLAANLGLTSYLKIPIQQSFDAFKAQMGPVFEGLAEDTTEENMQARLRGLTLMSLSNKFGSLLLTTGNKSELAVGYCTLYGDMCGGLAVISDVPKTMVYQLAHYLNREREIIPPNTIEKPPSAELRPDQKDQDTLPPYDLLDEILALYVEENLSGADIITRGFDEQIVRWIVRRVDLNEYKREQAAPGLKVTGRAFGIGRRMPIAQRFVA